METATQNTQSARYEGALDAMAKSIVARKRAHARNRTDWQKDVELVRLARYYNKHRPPTPPNSDSIETRLEHRDVGQLLPSAPVVGGEIVKVSGVVHTFGDKFYLEYDLYEVVDPRAFNRVLSEKPKILFNAQHQDEYSFASTTGGGLVLRVTPTALEMTAAFPLTAFSQHFLAGVEAGVYNKMSFRFSIKQQRFDYVSDTAVRRTILEVDTLWDVAMVSFPAYPQTRLVVIDSGSRSRSRLPGRSAFDEDYLGSFGADQGVGSDSFGGDPESQRWARWVAGLKDSPPDRESDRLKQWAMSLQ